MEVERSRENINHHRPSPLKVPEHLIVESPQTTYHLIGLTQHIHNHLLLPHDELRENLNRIVLRQKEN